MKKKDLEKIKGRSVVELKKDIEEKKDKLWQLRSDIVTGKAKNVRGAGSLKRDVARSLTILNEKIKSEDKEQI